MLNEQLGVGHESISDNEFCLEVAVFHAENLSDELQKQANGVFRQYVGFIASLALVCTNDENLRADLVIWASLKDALQAAEAFKIDPNLSTYASSIKKLDTFGHYRAINADTFTQLAKASLVELRGYKRLFNDVVEPRRKVHEALMESKEATVNIPVNTVTEAFEETGITPEVIDITGWSSQEAYKNKPKTLFFKHPELKPFIESESENIAISRTFRMV